jgi:hypothetical protein
VICRSVTLLGLGFRFLVFFIYGACKMFLLSWGLSLRFLLCIAT